MCAAVTSIDIHEDFCEGARQRLDAARIGNANVLCMDASSELPDRLFDAIAVSASMPHVDERLVEALKPGGRLFLVVGKSPLMNAVLITRDGEHSQQQDLFQTDIPPLVSAVENSVFSF
jgi:protein-L-isoaspartate(D-aspartate) O-methyltransferase